ncbi:MAG: hypothetical protein LN568_02245 [Rickettsia endosymbiont of Pseudomimeciton antennatum]|nr:hypothetical protein [Rickettsia endosymbiont of Pseudomimeciton antennatum]
MLHRIKRFSSENRLYQVKLILQVLFLTLVTWEFTASVSQCSDEQLKEVMAVVKIMVREPREFLNYVPSDDYNTKELTKLFKFCDKNELVRAIFDNFEW